MAYKWMAIIQLRSKRRRKNNKTIWYKKSKASENGHIIPVHHLSIIIGLNISQFKRIDSHSVVSMCPNNHVKWEAQTHTHTHAQTLGNHCLVSDIGKEMMKKYLSDWRCKCLSTYINVSWFLALLFEPGLYYWASSLSEVSVQVNEWREKSNSKIW